MPKYIDANLLADGTVRATVLSNLAGPAACVRGTLKNRTLCRDVLRKATKKV
jgi:hypothetical protein